MRKKLKEECYITMGQSPKGDTYNSENKGIPFLQGRRTFGRMYPTVDTWTTNPIRIAKKDSVLMSVRAPVGDINIANKVLCIGRGLCSLEMKNGNNMYLYYLLQNNIDKLKRKSSGTVFDSINSRDIENLELNFHTEEQQNRIIKILSDIDKKIEINNRISNNLQEIINTTFRRWFIEYEFPTKSGKEYNSSGGKMIDSEMGLIPENWEICELKDLVKFSNGCSIDSKLMIDNEKDNTFKVFKMANIKIGGGINKDKTKSWFSKDDCEGLDKYIAKKGDILMCMTDMKNSGTPLLGHTALIDKDNEFIINQRVGILRCKKDKIDFTYLYTLSNLDFFLQDIRSRANSGVQVNLSTKGICETLLRYPDKEILKKFTELSLPMYEKKFCIENENETLIKLRDTVLSKLMNGEITIENIEI